jgi:Uma2 family endonuclease
MAAMQAASPRVSYADLEKWPDDGRRYELYDGEVYVIPSPLPVHQIAAARLYDLLHEYCRAQDGIVLFAPVDIVLTDCDVVQPNLLTFRADRVDMLKPRQVTRQPPDLAVEILSPSTARNDRGRKMALLARHGVKEFWLVDPDAVQVEIYRLEGSAFVLASAASGSDTAQSHLFHGLQVRPSQLAP